MEILHLLPGHHFVFAESEEAFTSEWRASHQAGEMLRVLACTETRRVWHGRLDGPAPAARWIQLNPLIIESATPWTADSVFGNEPAGALHGELMTAWEQALPEDERRTRERDRDEVEQRERSTWRAGWEGCANTLRVLARELDDVDIETTAFHRAGNPPFFEGWLLATMEERWRQGDPAARVPSPDRVFSRAVALLGDGSLIRATRTPITRDPGVARRIAYKTLGVGGDRLGPHRKLVGHRWVLDHVVDLAEASHSPSPSALDPRLTWIEAAGALAAKHRVDVVFPAHDELVAPNPLNDRFKRKPGPQWQIAV